MSTRAPLCNNMTKRERELLLHTAQAFLPSTVLQLRPPYYLGSDHSLTFKHDIWDNGGIFGGLMPHMRMVRFANETESGSYQCPGYQNLHQVTHFYDIMINTSVNVVLINSPTLSIWNVCKWIKGYFVFWGGIVIQ